MRAKYARLEVGEAPYLPPREHQIVVRNRAVAINPVDWITQASGAFIFSWLRFPCVLGSDTAGEVVAVGPGVSRFTIGDRVVAHALGTSKPRNSSAEGAFQKYTVILEHMASPIPNNLPFERAAVLPLGLSTAACGLFQADCLGLDRPSAVTRRNGKMLLVWGGSTSVGSNAIQLAVAAGYDVVTTASPHNFAYAKQLGASLIFDYRSATVIRDVIAALKGTELAGALAIGRGSPEACVDIVGACASRGFVAVATIPTSFDAIGERGMSAVQIASIARQFIWFNLSMRLRASRRGVRWKFFVGDSLADNDVGRLIYEDFLPAALADGRFTPAPEPEVIGSGLDRIQAAFDVQRKGVSASKIVISLS